MAQMSSWSNDLVEVTSSHEAQPLFVDGISKPRLRRSAVLSRWVCGSIPGDRYRAFAAGRTPQEAWGEWLRSVALHRLAVQVATVERPR